MSGKKMSLVKLYSHSTRDLALCPMFALSIQTERAKGVGKRCIMAEKTIFFKQGYTCTVLAWEKLSHHSTKICSNSVFQKDY